MTNLIIVQLCSFQSSVYLSFRFQTTLSHDSVKSKAQYDCTSQRTNWPLLFCLHVNEFQFLVFPILNPLLFQYVGFVCCCDLISFCFVFSVDDMTASVSGGRKCCSGVVVCSVVLRSAYVSQSTLRQAVYQFRTKRNPLSFIFRVVNQNSSYEPVKI